MKMRYSHFSTAAFLLSLTLGMASVFAPTVEGLTFGMDQQEVATAASGVKRGRSGSESIDAHLEEGTEAQGPTKKRRGGIPTSESESNNAASGPAEEVQSTNNSIASKVSGVKRGRSESESVPATASTAA